MRLWKQPVRERRARIAVVAEEVRNLAMRAAEAAKTTSVLIESTINNVRTGNDLTKLTQTAFKENIEIANKVANLIEEIAAASHEQAQGIDLVAKAVTEMDKVTQESAATAEETASSAEEMNAQAMQMKSSVGELTAIVGTAKEAAPGTGGKKLLGFRTKEKDAARPHKALPPPAKPAGKPASRLRQRHPSPGMTAISRISRQLKLKRLPV